MPEFPITYSNRLPPKESPDVRANLDVSIGSAKADLWGEVAKSGAVISDIGFKFWEKAKGIQDRIDTAEFDTKVSEVYSVAYQEANKTTNSEERTAILRSAKEKARKIFDDNPKSMWEDRLIRAEGAFSEDMLKIDRAKTANELSKRYELQMQAAIERGDMEFATSLTNDMVEYGLILPEERNKLLKETPNNILISQAQKLIYGGDVAGAKVLLDKLDKESATPQQIRLASSLKTVANKEDKTILKNFRNEVAETMLKYDEKDLSPTEMYSAAQEIVKTIRMSGIDPVEQQKEIKRVYGWYNGEGQVNSGEIAALEDRINNVIIDRVDDPDLKDDINKAYMSGVFGRRGKRATEHVQRLLKNLKSGQSSTVRRAGVDAINMYLNSFDAIELKGLGLSASVKIQMNEMMDRYLVENPKATTMDVTGFILEQSASFRGKGEDEIKKMLGEQIKQGQVKAIPAIKTINDEKSWNEVKIGDRYRLPSDKPGEYRTREK